MENYFQYRKKSKFKGEVRNNPQILVLTKDNTGKNVFICLSDHHKVMLNHFETNEALMPQEKCLNKYRNRKRHLFPHITQAIYYCITTKDKSCHATDIIQSCDQLSGERFSNENFQPKFQGTVIEIVYNFKSFLI